MGVDQVAKHDHSSEADGGTEINPTVTDTEDVDVTGVTFVEAHLGSDKTGNSANSWINALDTEDEDVKDEFDGDQFTPSSTGWYSIEASVRIESYDGDRLAIRFRDTDGNATIQQNQYNQGGSGAGYCTVGITAKLTGGNVHELQAVNTDSTFTIQGGKDRTYLVIKKSAVHP